MTHTQSNFFTGAHNLELRNLLENGYGISESLFIYLVHNAMGTIHMRSEHIE